MNRAQWIRAVLAVVLAIAGIAAMRSFGALQLPSLLMYSGIVLLGFGAITFLIPTRWSGFRRRVHGLAVGFVAGAVLIGAGWFWPAHAHFAGDGPGIDAFLPNYDFHERHEILVHAPAQRVREVFDRISFADIGVMQTLGRIRAVAMGQFRNPPAQGASPAIPIVEMMQNPRSGFFPLYDSPGEFVFGLAGQPWSNRGVRLQPDQFRDWAPRGNVKIAANFRMEAAGPNLTRVITETRISATDAAARRKMARYWALIYPGSGMIRHSLLRAIRDRAETR
jgi:hypothetical protein